jgi:hypothetical protein
VLSKLIDMTTATNSRVTNLIALIPMLTGIGRLLAFLVPTDCLRSLENWPPFQRAFRQYVGNAEAIDPLYDEPRRQPGGNCTDFLRWNGQPFLSPLKQIEMATSKGVSSNKIMNDPAYERTRENMVEFGLHLNAGCFLGGSSCMIREVGAGS